MLEVYTKLSDRIIEKIEDLKKLHIVLSGFMFFGFLVIGLLLDLPYLTALAFPQALISYFIYRIIEIIFIRAMAIEKKEESDIYKNMLVADKMILDEITREFSSPGAQNKDLILSLYKRLTTSEGIISGYNIMSNNSWDWNYGKTDKKA